MILSAKPAISSRAKKGISYPHDETARKQVAAICRDLGWGVIDMGGMAAARLLEPLALIYIQTAIRTGSWDYAFKLLKA